MAIREKRVCNRTGLDTDYKDKQGFIVKEQGGCDCGGQRWMENDKAETSGVGILQKAGRRDHTPGGLWEMSNWISYRGCSVTAVEGFSPN